jgi:membrane protease YdiL (CAAX protease family)
LEALAITVGAYAAGHLVRILLLQTAASPTAHVAWRSVAQLLWIALVAGWLSLRGWTSAFGRPARVWREVRDGAVFGAILYGLVALVVVLPLAWLIELATDRQVTAPQPFDVGLPPLGLALAGALALLIAPAAEELLFRGVLFPALRDRFGLGAGIAASAVAFGLAHYLPGDPIEVMITISATTVIGASLAIQYERRGTLLAPLSAHVAFNAVGLSILLFR